MPATRIEDLSNEPGRGEQGSASSIGSIGSKLYHPLTCAGACDGVSSDQRIYGGRRSSYDGRPRRYFRLRIQSSTRTHSRQPTARSSLRRNARFILLGGERLWGAGCGFETRGRLDTKLWDSRLPPERAWDASFFGSQNRAESVQISSRKAGSITAERAVSQGFAKVQL